MITYETAHARLRKARGSARAHRCAMDGCSEQAAEWSYDHADPAELVDPDRGLPYSLDVARYRPMCRACHIRYDREASDWSECAASGCAALARYDLCGDHGARARRAAETLARGHRRKGLRLGHQFRAIDEHDRRRPPRVTDDVARPDKACSACKVVKPAAAFSLARGKASGLASRCLVCDRACAAERYRRKRGL